MTPEEWLDQAEDHGDDEHETTRGALRAVLELHQPVKRVGFQGGVFVDCTGCLMSPYAQCPVRRTITETLGLTNDKENTDD